MNWIELLAPNITRLSPSESCYAQHQPIKYEYLFVADAYGKKQVEPPVTQVYTNRGFVEHESYESQGTLQVRQPEVVQSSAVPIGK